LQALGPSLRGEDKKREQREQKFLFYGAVAHKTIVIPAQAERPTSTLDNGPAHRDAGHEQMSGGIVCGIFDRRLTRAHGEESG